MPNPSLSASGRPLGKSDIATVIRQFEDMLRQKEAVCGELEHIADCLPDSLDTHRCLETARRLQPLIHSAHRFEEDTLFPLLLQLSPHRQDLTVTIERLRCEHWGDEDFAEHIHDMIAAFVATRELASADTLSWVLRGFFQNLQRHVAYDREVILPLLRVN